MRDFMTHVFNVSLKFLFYSINPEEFRKYCYNCCRQTAIFGTIIMTEKYPDYEFSAYEGVFKDIVFGQEIEYEHAFIIGKKKGTFRELLIDLATTWHPIVFQPIVNGKFVYPDTPDYKDMKLLYSDKIDINEMMENTVTEYLTGEKPQVVLDFLRILMRSFYFSDKETQHDLTQKIYGLANEVKL